MNEESLNSWLTPTHDHTRTVTTATRTNTTNETVTRARTTNETVYANDTATCARLQLHKTSHGTKREIGARPEVFGGQVPADHLIAESAKLGEAFLGLRML